MSHQVAILLLRAKYVYLRRPRTSISLPGLISGKIRLPFGPVVRAIAVQRWTLPKPKARLRVVG